MPAVTYDLYIEQGATFVVAFQWRQDDGSNPPSGPFVDTTNYAPHMQIKARPGAEALNTFDSTSGLTVDSGVITLRIGADVTDTMTQGGVYDIEMHNTLDPTDVIRLVQGKVSISPQVTTS